jgi:hypothetical protein
MNSDNIYLQKQRVMKRKSEDRIQNYALIHIFHEIENITKLLHL